MDETSISAAVATAAAELVNFTQAASLRAVHRSVVYDWVSENRVQPVSIGGRRFLRRSEVMAVTIRPNIRRRTTAH